MSSGSPHGMASSGIDSRPAPALSARCDDERVYVRLTAGREVTSPLPEWLRAVPAAKRRRCHVRGFGTAIYFPDLDEEMGVNEVFGVPEDVLYELAGFRKGPRSAD